MLAHGLSRTCWALAKRGVGGQGGGACGAEEGKGGGGGGRTGVGTGNDNGMRLVLINSLSKERRVRFGECGYAIGILPFPESSFLFGICDFYVIFPHFRGSDRGGEFCNLSPFFGDFRPGGFPGPLGGKQLVNEVSENYADICPEIHPEMFGAFPAGRKVLPPISPDMSHQRSQISNQISLRSFTTHFCGHGNPNTSHF